MIEFFYRNGVSLQSAANAKVQVGKNGNSGFVTVLENCGRCGGQGGSPHWRPDGGVCYQCRGRRQLPATHRVFTEDRLQVLVNAANVKADKTRVSAARETNKKRLEFIAWAKEGNYGPLIGQILLAAKPFSDDFLSSLAGKLRRWWVLTERQIAAAQKVFESRKKMSAADANSKWVGDIKDRLEFEGVILGVLEIVGYYGTTDVIRIRDLDDNVYTWFASGVHDVARGDRVAIKGTVKKHDEFRGVKQTVITRCKLTKFEVMTADEAANMDYAEWNEVNGQFGLGS